jgi:hypothetical protein
MAAAAGFGAFVIVALLLRLTSGRRSKTPAKPRDE